MALEPAITDVEQLKEKPALAKLLASETIAVEQVKWDRNELTIWIPRENIVEAVRVLRNSPETQFNFLADITCVDW